MSWLRQGIRKAFMNIWVRRVLGVLALIGLCFAIWVGFTWIPWGFVQTVWFRLLIIGLILGTAFTIAFLKWRKHRRAARELEENLITEPTGDSDVLQERMSEALARLKQRGGATYLYDLPWYVIIGPPGAGKTTALVHSGLEFPGTDAAAVAGFGGTANCDFWFAEEAVLIDTAGRYTTQDSDAENDKASWMAFLEQLKRGRPDQPINGILLAFSCEDMMTASPEALDQHALTVRARLTELHEALGVYVPVYAVFTKADKIVGFREYFGVFGEDRRRKVWGATFQNKENSVATEADVPEEFDKLIQRLSDEVTDRLVEEPDGVSRIAIFGLPGQMMMMRQNIADFLRRVFQQNSETGAYLRGFYFTSGTQEGSPIDQVLGQMSSSDDGMQPDFMSGKGRAYFLHDLLKKVIFEECNWVGYDKRVVRRRAIFRTIGMSAVGLATAGLIGLFSVSYWRNANLVDLVNDRTESYTFTHMGVVEPTEPISDPDPQPIITGLTELRRLPTGYEELATDARPPFYERAGLSQKRFLQRSSVRAYSRALERGLRPRMALYVENELPKLEQAGDNTALYTALKVYLLLANEQPAAADEETDQIVLNYFAREWAQFFDEFTGQQQYDELIQHITAMLDLDDEARRYVSTREAIRDPAQRYIANQPLVEQAWGLINERIETTELPPWQLDQAIGTGGELVFRTKDNAPLDTVRVPALFTFAGYWAYFREEMQFVSKRLQDDRWVLGQYAEAGPRGVNFDGQLRGLTQNLHLTYANAFGEAWDKALDKIELVPMAASDGSFSALSEASSLTNSPILRLSEAIVLETQLSRFQDSLDQLDPAAALAGGGGLQDQLVAAGFDRAEASSGYFQRIVLNQLKNSTGKVQATAGAGGLGGGAGAVSKRMIEDLERKFAKYHGLAKGEQPKRPIDLMIRNLRQLLENRLRARNSSGPTLQIDQREMEDILINLETSSNNYPAPYIGFVKQIEREFLTVSENATLEAMEAAFTEEVVGYCRNNIRGTYPFSNGGPHVSIKIFSEFFGPQGRMKRFYDENLAAHVDRDNNGRLVPSDRSNIASRFNRGTLDQFERAENIRQAFFFDNGQRPEVAFSVKMVNGSRNVVGAEMNMGSEARTALLNGASVSFQWPGDGGGNVSLFPIPSETGRGLQFDGGAWAIVDFLRFGFKSSENNEALVTPQVDGRSIGLRFIFDSSTVPFLMRDLVNFKCPTSLE